jgi:protein involved in polysaccharide export with SLBB domain
MTEKEAVIENTKSNKLTTEKNTTTDTELNIAYDKTVYGAELFSKNSTVFEPNIRIATPSNYILGPDDEIIIHIYGFSEKQYILEVNKEGNIYIPGVGPLEVNGITMEQATAKIRSKLSSTIYTALTNGRTKLQVSLGKIKSIQVTVIGEANKPGTYTVSSMTTLFNLLYLCGGPSKFGTYRNIEIVRGKKAVRVVDMYDFFSKGDRSDDVLLQEHDVIRIPYCTNRVEIQGEVRRPGKFEFTQNESFETLLRYCGGLKDEAYQQNVTVYRFENKNRMVRDLFKDSFSLFLPKSGDVIYVNKMPAVFSNRLVIGGSVFIPGNYELSNGVALRQLIARAGGLLPDAYTKHISVFRYFENKLPTTASYNLDSLIANNADVFLEKDDSVHIYSIFDFREDQPVYVEGFVRNPGIFNWRDNITLADIIAEAGGIVELGDSANIEISSRNKEVDFRTNQSFESNIIALNILTDSNAGNYRLAPYDVVIVKKKPSITNQRMVIIEGEVILPGKYILKKSNDRILDILERSGGFKYTADSNYATIRRIIKSNFTFEEKERIFRRLLNNTKDTLEKNKTVFDELSKSHEIIRVNLYNLFRDGNQSSDNLILEDGDILQISKKTNIVKVFGEIYYPNIITHREDKNAKFYIRQAGNFMPTAEKDKMIVIYPNGRTSSIKKFLFFRKYPKVLPGSEIFVPQKNNKAKKGLSLAEWSVLVSSLALIGNMIISLNNKN